MSNRPSNVMPLTKAQILNGRNYTETVYIPALNGNVTIRVLTSGEIAQAEAIQASAMSLTMNPDAGDDEAMRQSSQINVDMERMSIAEYRANVLIVSCGLSVPGQDIWTTEDVDQIAPAQAVEQIAGHVRRISKVKGGVIEQIQNFRDESGGTGDRAPAHVGNAAGNQSDGANRDAVNVPGPRDGGDTAPAISPVAEEQPTTGP